MQAEQSKGGIYEPRACAVCGVVFAPNAAHSLTCGELCRAKRTSAERARRQRETRARAREERGPVERVSPMARKPTAAQQPGRNLPPASKHTPPKVDRYRWDLKTCQYCQSRGRFEGYYCTPRCEDAAKAPVGWDGRNKARPYTCKDGQA